MSPSRATPTLVLAMGLLSSCDELLPDLDLERMLDQPSDRPYDASNRFEDGRAMRPPPAGTVARGEVLGPPGVTEGSTDGRVLDQIPVPVDRAVLRRGRDRFDIFCAACHGVQGAGESPVARQMTFRAPPSLVAEPVTTFAPGRIYRVITFGYGFMPSYARDLTMSDRWAVVAYVRALQTSQGARLDDLPPKIRAEAEAALP